MPAPDADARRDPVPRLRALADPADPTSWHPRLLWWAVLDGRYLAEARRGPGRRVLLLAFDAARTDLPLARWHVDARRSGPLGPDPDDVRSWKLLLEAWADGPSGDRRAPRSRRAVRAQR